MKGVIMKKVWMLLAAVLMMGSFTMEASAKIQGMECIATISDRSRYNCSGYDYRLTIPGMYERGWRIVHVTLLPSGDVWLIVEKQ